MGVVKEIYVRRVLQTANEFETKLLVVVPACVARVGVESYYGSLWRTSGTQWEGERFVLICVHENT